MFLGCSKKYFFVQWLCICILQVAVYTMNIFMTIRIDGKKIADTIKADLAEKIKGLDREIVFSIIYVGQDSVIDNFIKYKKQFGEHIGVKVVVHSFRVDIKQYDLEQQIREIEKTSDAMIVQLPLPEHLDTQEVLDMIPTHKDVDVLSSKTKSSFNIDAHAMYPPVVGAMVHILQSQNFSLKGKHVVLVGHGNLVGKPFAHLLESMEFPYSVVDKNTSSIEKKELIKSADVIVSGAGVPGLITANMIKSGVVLLDGGTSEAGKRVTGDIDPGCYELALFYTPVPGGIGPLTIAVLYQNILKAVLLNNNK